MGTGWMSINPINPLLFLDQIPTFVHEICLVRIPSGFAMVCHGLATPESTLNDWSKWKGHSCGYYSPFSEKSNSKYACWWYVWWNSMEYSHFISIYLSIYLSIYIWYLYMISIIYMIWYDVSIQLDSYNFIAFTTPGSPSPALPARRCRPRCLHWSQQSQQLHRWAQRRLYPVRHSQRSPLEQNVIRENVVKPDVLKDTEGV